MLLLPLLLPPPLGCSHQEALAAALVDDPLPAQVSPRPPARPPALPPPSAAAAAA